jgi:hypothetical protein
VAAYRFGWLIPVVICLSAATPPDARAADTGTQRLRPFTVIDSIELPRVMDIGGSYSVNIPDVTALTSPDGSRFVIRTQHGDLRRNKLVHTLHVYDAREVSSFLDQPAAQLPRPRVTSTLTSNGTLDALAHLQWISDSELAFVSSGDNGRQQIFVLDASADRAYQLTHHPTDVVDYAILGDTVLYFARIGIANPHAIEGADRSFGELLAADDARLAPLELFHGARSRTTVTRVALPPLALTETRISIAPDARHALISVPIVDTPHHWRNYRVFSNALWGFEINAVNQDPSSWAHSQYTRYAVLDLAANTARNLMDAPDGRLSFNGTPAAVFWPRGGNTVLVSNVYLPLQVDDESERARRMAGPAIAEIDLNSGEAAAVLWEPTTDVARMSAGDRAPHIRSVAWDRRTQTLTVQREQEDGSRQVDVRRKRGVRWQAMRANTVTADLQIDRVEELNRRPKVFVYGARCNCHKELFDPAPEADAFSWARVEPVSWVAPDSGEWHGGLMYPIDYEAGRAYPIVVQTHGFNKDEFLIDGPSGFTTAFSAQALASAGMFVLQIEENPRAVTLDAREPAKVVAGYRAAIRKLADEKLIAVDRVGLITFSRTGFYAIQYLAEDPRGLAALTIADSVQPGYVQYVLAQGSGDFSRQLHSSVGGSPAQLGYGAWFAQNPLYRIANSSTPIRMETIGSGSLVAMWETIALLREAGRPVDLVHYPRGEHVLATPAERLETQGGNVDWMRFWLQGYEDPSSAKQARYARWRQMRQSSRSDVSQNVN